MSRAGSLALFVMFLALSVASGAPGLVGCAGTVRSAAVNASRAGVPVVVDESLGAMEDPHTRERLEQIMASPEMQGAIQETAHALVLGALQSRGENSADSPLGVAAGLTDTVAAALARDIREEIVPATVQGMRDSLHDVLSADDGRAILRTLDSAVGQATAAAIRSASTELPRSLAPAMRAALVENLNSADLRAAVASMTADATRSALMSSRDVLLDLHEHDEEAGPVAQLVDRIQRMLERIVVVTFLIGALLGALLVWVSRHFRRGGSGAPPPGPAGPTRPERVAPGSSAPASSSGSGESGSADSDVEGAPIRLDPSRTRAS
jgi:hypothetical protein